MPVIDPTNPAALEDSCTYWQAELKNSRILLFKINEAIAALTTGGHQSYQLDTGQSNQRVTRMDIESLTKQREDLTNQIRNLEMFLGEGKPAIKQVRPGW